MSKRPAPGSRPRLKYWIRGLGALVILAALIASVTPPGERFLAQTCYELGFNDWRDEAGLLEVHIIDVGKADSILIRSRDHAALIDAGRPDCACSVVDYLLRHNVSYLDYLVMSHPDSDHIGGMLQLLDEIEVGTFIQADIEYDSGKGSRLSELLAGLRRKKIGTVKMSPGGSFALGEAVFTAISPAGNFGDPNNSSLVLRMDCMGFSALFCGDIEREAEEVLVFSGQDLDVELLKVGHHGSNTSSCRQLLEKVSPKYAAISTGLDRNLLPRDEVLIRLEETGAEIYRTDTDGNIVFIYDGLNVRVRLEKEERTDYETVEHRPF